nr:ribosomal protein L12 [Cryptomonas borealis]
MTTKIEEIIEQLKSLTLLEAADLVKRIEETFNVSASMSGTANINNPISNTLSQEVEEKTQFDLILEEVPADKKIPILKVVRTLTGLGLKEAKDLVEATPKNIKENASKEEVEEAKKQLEEAGAKVKIK